MVTLATAASAAFGLAYIDICACCRVKVHDSSLVAAHDKWHHVPCCHMSVAIRAINSISRKFQVSKETRRAPHSNFHAIMTDRALKASRNRRMTA